MIKISNILLVVIIFLAAFLRFYKLGKVPASLYWDEVSIGYNAYSVLKTGKDEYGEFLPLRFKAFGEYKLPLYIYLTVPVIKIFGLNEFSVRFPSAFFGSLTVLLTYFLTKEIFKKSHYSLPLTLYLPTTASFLLAISPWHLQFSRAAFEANIGLFFFCLGLFLLLKKSFAFAALVLTFSLYSYYSFWLVVPFLMIYFFFLFSKKKILLSTLLILILALPLIHSVFFQKQQARLEQVSIIGDPKTLEKSLERKARVGNSFLSRIFYHRFAVWGKTVFENYSLHFSPKFLFFRGDNSPRHSPYKSGLLFPLTLPFVAGGLFSLLRKKEKLVTTPAARRSRRRPDVRRDSAASYEETPRLHPRGVLTFLVLISPLAASFSSPAPHALRSLLMVIPWQIITAVGLVCFFKFLKKPLRVLIALLLSFIFCYSFVSYLDNYYTHGYLHQALDWGDGYKQLLEFVKEKEEDFDKIYITGSRWQPYIYTLFYLRFNPVKYQAEGSDHGHFGKFYFGESGWDKAGERFYRTKVDFEKFLASDNNLVIHSLDEALVVSPFKKIYSVNREEVFLIYDFKNPN